MPAKIEPVKTIEYALVFGGIGEGAETHPLPGKSPRQVKRYLDGLRGNVRGEVTVVARGRVELTSDWIEVSLDEELYPAIPSWTQLGHAAFDEEVPTPRPLVPEIAEPVVPPVAVAPAPTPTPKSKPAQATATTPTTQPAAPAPVPTKAPVLP